MADTTNTPPPASPKPRRAARTSARSSAAKPAPRKAAANGKAAAKPAAKPAAKSAAKSAAKPRAATKNTARPIRESVAATGSTIRTEAQRKAGEIGDEMTRLLNQATSRAADVAREGKHRTASGLESLAKAIDDTAGTVDDRLGKQYGDFARSAASSVAGLAGTLEQKDLDELVASTREFVKKSPAVAIGSAAVVGFMLARLMRGSNNS